MVGELHPRVNEALGLPAHSAAFELNLTALFGTLDGKPVQAKPIATFPPVKQDLAFTVDQSVTAAQLEAVVREAAGANLESIELFDVFTGEQVGEGKKSLAFAVTFRSPSKTLSAEDSEAIRKAIVDKAEARRIPSLRKSLRISIAEKHLSYGEIVDPAKPGTTGKPAKH